MSDVEDLLTAVREAARPATWTQGLNLSRSGAVAISSRSGDSVDLRVRVPSRPVAFNVSLYPGDEDWECDCPGKLDPCDHVVAAAIALGQDAKDGPAAKPLVQAAERWSRVVYRFAREPGGGLSLTRALTDPEGGDLKPLQGTLQSMVARPAQAARLQVEQWDLIADRLLERPHRGALPPERLERLLTVLENSREVLLDGEPVALASEPIFPHAVIEDRGDQLQLTIRRDPRIIEVVSAGVGLTRDSLALLGETQIAGTWLQNLPITRSYPQNQLAELSGKV
ncbi:MAG TPA: SWIM zinc finger family protein, partial [Myxococcaceae bacterium]|nr:SWIM zinc finger family protein [Myxococcaceae bacterium]